MSRFLSTQAAASSCRLRLACADWSAVIATPDRFSPIRETSESPCEGLLLDTEQAIEAMREGPSKVAVHHVSRNIELSRDLVGLQPVEAMQDENGALARRKLGNGLAQDRKAGF